MVAQTVARLHEQLDSAAYDAAWAQGQRLPMDDAVALAAALPQPAIDEPPPTPLAPLGAEDVAAGPSAPRARVTSNHERAALRIKPPGVAETIDWVRTLELLAETELDARTVSETIGAVVKERDDLELVRANLDRIARG